MYSFLNLFIRSFIHAFNESLSGSTLTSLALCSRLCSHIPVGALNRCHLSNWRFNPETVHFLRSKRRFLPTMFVSKSYKTKHFGQDSLLHKKPKHGRKNHYFTVLKWGKGRNHYKNHDLGHNHWKRSAKRPKIDPFWTQNVHGFQVRTPIWQMAPISRRYPPPSKKRKIRVDTLWRLPGDLSTRQKRGRCDPKFKVGWCQELV